MDGTQKDLVILDWRGGIRLEVLEVQFGLGLDLVGVELRDERLQNCIVGDAVGIVTYYAVDSLMMEWILLL